MRSKYCSQLTRLIMLYDCFGLLMKGRAKTALMPKWVWLFAADFCLSDLDWESRTFSNDEYDVHLKNQRHDSVE
jgi:hypothetical protein